VAAVLGEDGRAADADVDLPWECAVLGRVQRQIAQGAVLLAPAARAVELQVAVARAQDDADEAGAAQPALDAVFRLQAKRWPMQPDDLAGLRPLRDPRLRVIAFDFDVVPFLQANSITMLPAETVPRRSFVVVSASADAARDPLVVDGLTARVLQRADGLKTVAEILTEVGETPDAENLAWVEGLFRLGLIGLSEFAIGPRCDGLVRGAGLQAGVI
jgi:hypothetical protein